MSGAAERLPLTGADCFLRAFDAETRRRNGASHLAQLVLRLGPGFDAEALQRVLHAASAAQPILRAPIRRRLGVGAPEYRLDHALRCPAPRVEVHDASASSPGLDPLLAERLDEVRSASDGELLRVDAVRRADAGTDVAFTWLHLLFDGWGCERFVEWLEACRAGRCTPHDVPASDRPGAPADLPLPAGSRERGAMAMSWQRWMSGLGRLGVRSPAGPARRVPQDLDYERVTFSASESARIAERARSVAGFLTPMIYYMAAAIRAHHEIQRRRGAVPESYVVPLPVNLRPKGGQGGIFRTRVSLVWFQVPSSGVEDEAGLLGELKEQRRRAIREGQIANGVAAMDYARFAPARLYALQARRNLGGELCSFFFAYTGQFCPELTHFFGACVEDGFHVPSVPASPGSSLVFSFRGERLGYTHVRQRDVFTPQEIALLRETLARVLMGTP
jgi:hypothetical protein